MRTTLVIVLAGFFSFECGMKEHTNLPSQISGIYVHEYSFKVMNPNNGAEIGLRTVRDTIFIKQSSDGFDVSNSKWSLNSYDRDGWRDMAHAEDRPFPAFRGVYNPTNQTLEFNSSPYLFLDIGNQQLFKGEDRRVSFQKLE